MLDPFVCERMTASYLFTLHSYHLPHLEGRGNSCQADDMGISSSILSSQSYHSGINVLSLQKRPHIDFSPLNPVQVTSIDPGN